MKVKEESEKVGLKLNILKTKIMASGPITSWEIDGETVETVADFMDWEMPVLDGGKLVLALRSAQVETPVIMLSGSFAGNSLPDVIAREVFAALTKPVTLSAF